MLFSLPFLQQGGGGNPISSNLTLNLPPSGSSSTSPLSSPSSTFATIYSSLDYLLIPSLILLSLSYTLPSFLDHLTRPSPKRSDRPPSSSSSSSSSSAFILPALTRHARFLPKPSSHKFKYQTLYLALRLDRLESHKLDTSYAFSWRGNYLEPEWQDEILVAERRSLVVNPSAQIPPTIPSSRSFSVNGTVERDSNTKEQVEQEQDSAKSQRLGEWKETMRRSERRERRKKMERRRKRGHSPFTWSFLGLHPDSYLRVDFPEELATEGVDDGGTSWAGSMKKRAEWLKGSILLKLAYELREKGYLSVGPQDETGIGGGEKGWRNELGQVWTVTMPSIAGFKGINPLTVHYCYRPARSVTQTGREDFDEEARGEFWLAVLEVHNTFNERHIYVLQAGVDEDDEIDGEGSRWSDSEEGKGGQRVEGGVITTQGQSAGGAKRRRSGYDHQWTFPRTFHVSPFNDRGGYYRLFLREPFPRVCSDGSSKEAEVGGGESPFHLDIRLLLLVEDESKKEDGGGTGTASSGDTITTSEQPRNLRKKLMASLQSYPMDHSRRPLPFSTLNLYVSILRQPLDLFLTTARILLEAAKLHFTKKLDAFGRPDMVQLEEVSSESPTTQKVLLASRRARDDDYDGVGLPPSLNPIQPHRGHVPGVAAAKGGGLLYPPESSMEKTCKDEVISFLRWRVENWEEGVKLQIRICSTDPAQRELLIREVGSDSDRVEGSREEDDPFEKQRKEEARRELILFTRSPYIYVDLMISRTPQLALETGSKSGRRWGVNDTQLFFKVFSSPQSKQGPAGGGGGFLRSRLEGIRTKHLQWQLDCCRERGLTILPSSLLDLVGPRMESLHFTNLVRSHEKGGGLLYLLNLIKTLHLIHFSGVMEKALFDFVGARYVQGTEPWLELYRALIGNERRIRPDHSHVDIDVKLGWDEKLGSVRRSERG
ncbi:hypothetical protein IE53DRAFT_385120 [Violaceomyces palustris]|uniref:Uncharacterized protein n=1 Tax=Violaceomyces palustris TaxID=1673888 RepID=A0ACD0P352_9BASI|nr:hypothetical protein IE53DRAFT_385120 [Violaceomyces palustris]